MLGLVVRLLAMPVMMGAGFVFAKPEQIRSDQSPTFHYYLQAYPKNGVSISVEKVSQR